MAATTLARATPADEVRSFLELRAGDLAKVCDAHITPERVIQLAVIVGHKTPKVLECDRETILAALIQASSLGLSLEPSLGEAYLVPYGRVCQFMPGYQGLSKLAQETGKIEYIQARLVRERDTLTWTYDPHLRIAHEPVRGLNGGVVTDVYAIATLASGKIVGEILETAEVEFIRSKSKQPGSGPWVENWGEMAKKTAIRRLCKTLPKTPRLEAAIAAMDADFEPGAFDAPTKRQAIDNRSGHATGQYASPEESKAYLEAMEGYLSKRNAKWLDKNTDEFGEVTPGTKPELINKWQADNHLVKWAKATGQLSHATNEEQKNRQVGRYTGILYARTAVDPAIGISPRKALAKELERYCDEQERLAMELIRRANPQLFDPADVAPDDEPADFMAPDNT